MTSSWFFLYTLNYDARSTTRQDNKLVCFMGFVMQKHQETPRMGFVMQKHQETPREKTLNFASNGQEVQLLLHTVFLLFAHQE